MDARRRASETGLRRPVRVADASDPSFGLAERMQRYAVPGASVAVIEHGEIAWAAGYGECTPGGDPVSPSTRFQAASISKVVNALAVTALAGRGAFDLDDDVDVHLNRWHLRGRGADGTPVTIRRLLSHTGGTTTTGFGGSAVGDTLPTVVEILEGRRPANSAPVEVVHEPGTTFAYSGGGTTVLQLLIEDVTARSYADIVGDLVLQPLGMADSGFLQPPSAQTGDLARGHDGTGATLAGGWRVFPELAAAGLWSTAVDLARAVIGIQQHVAGERDDVVPTALAAQLVTPIAPGVHGLGPEVVGERRGRRFRHNGTNVGFCCQAEGFLDHRSGVVVMTNGDGGISLLLELLASIADAYGWPGFERRVVADVDVAAATLATFAGEYQSPTGRRIHLVHADGQLFTSMPYGRRVLIPQSATEFVDPDTGADFVFRLTDSGRPAAAEVRHGGELLVTYTPVGAARRGATT